MKKLLYVCVWLALGFGSLNLVANQSSRPEIGYFGATVIVATGPWLGGIILLTDYVPCALNCEGK